MRKWSSLTFLLLSYNITTIPSHGDTSVVIGNCNITNQGIIIKDGSVLNQVIDCLPKKAEDSFRVRYVWLNDLSFSFLISQVPTRSLDALLGSSPIIVKNEVYTEIEYIWSRFGRTLETERISGVNTDIYGLKGKSTSDSTAFWDLEDSMKNRLRFLRSEPIIWPHIARAQEMRSGLRMPGNMNITYGINNNYSGLDTELDYIRSNKRIISDISETILSCTLIYDYLSKNEFLNYWDDADKSVDMINQDKSFADYILPTGSDFEGRPSWISNGAYGQQAYLGRNNWPKDFLLRVGSLSIDNCADQRGFSSAALPRRMFVKFAVFEFSNSDFDLRSIKYKLDNKFELRIRANFIEERNAILGNISPGKNRSIIVPIAIELRYPLGDAPFRFIRKNDESVQFFREISGIDTKYFSINGWFPVLKDSFPPPSFHDITQKYLYGPTIEILSVNMSGEDIKIRSAPSVAAVTNGYFDEGSCPFLYFVKEDGAVSRFGRILIGASEKNKTRTETIRIPKDVKYIIIQEEEPEITFIDSLKITNKDGVEISDEIKNVKILPNKSVKLEVPSDEDDYPRNLIVKGFYRTAP